MGNLGKNSTLSFLIGIAVKERTSQSEQDDFYIECKSPMADVVKVVGDALLNGRVAPPAIYLRPTRHPAFCVMTAHVTGDFLLKMINKMGTLGPRPDDTH